MKLSTVVGVVGVAALGYLIYRSVNKDIVETPADVEEPAPLLLGGPAKENKAD